MRKVTKYLSSIMFNISLIYCITLLSGCDNERFDDQIPFVSFPDITINLKSQQYLALQNQVTSILLLISDY